MKTIPKSSSADGRCWDRAARMVGTLWTVSQSQTGVTTGELADFWGVNLRTVYRDIRALAQVGIVLEHYRLSGMGVGATRVRFARDSDRRAARLLREATQETPLDFAVGAGS